MSCCLGRLLSRRARRLTASAHPPPPPDLFGRYTLDAAVDFLFGAQTNSLKLHSDGAGQRAAAFVAAFNAVQKISTARLKLGPLWPVSELGGDRMQPHMDVINVRPFSCLSALDDAG